MMTQLPLPAYVEIEPTRGCNLRCRMCHVAFMNASVMHLDLDRVDLSFLKGCLVSIGAAFEPCIHPRINELIARLNSLDCRIILVTNAHNLHRKTLPALSDSRLEMVTFSFDGISKETYELIRVGGDYERTLDNIGCFVEAIRDRNALIAVNFTAMKANMHEIPAAPAFWEERNVHILRFISMVIREEDPFLSENSLWPCRIAYYAQLDAAAHYAQLQTSRITIVSPYYQAKLGIRNGFVHSENPLVREPRLYPRENLFGTGFGLRYPCKAPFASARVLWDGSVMLCHDHPVGNLYNQSFESLWNGPSAERLRLILRQSDSRCRHCDYFRLCLNSHFIDPDVPENYFSQSMLDRGFRADRLQNTQERRGSWPLPEDRS